MMKEERVWDEGLRAAGGSEKNHPTKFAGALREASKVERKTRERETVKLFFREFGDAHGKKSEAFCLKKIEEKRKSVGKGWD